MLTLDITTALAKMITPSHGIPDAEMLAMRTSMRRLVTQWTEECERGEHAWVQNPYNDAVIKQVKETAKRIHAEGIQTVVWIGIGGSGLGPKVIQEVFETPATIEFIVLDTIDPSTLALYLDIIDWKHTCIVVASKSGETLETMSAFFYFFEKLTQVMGKQAASRVVAITDPQHGSLHDFCNEQLIEMLPLPKEVGGRYSIFTPIGLLPLALLDTDISKFVLGATDIEAATKLERLDENPAAMLAAVQYLLESKRGYVIRVIMPYVRRLSSLARWNQQLIAESLGKNEVHNPFPLVALGTEDQHSLLQQWIQGPRKAWHLFIQETEKPRVFVPAEVPDVWQHIAGKSFGQLLDACLAGTSQGLTSAKRPYVTLSITRLDEYHLGQLFFCLLAEVVFLGKLYRIDPYGQPGVEQSKKFTKEILTRGRNE